MSGAHKGYSKKRLLVSLKENEASSASVDVIDGLKLSSTS